MHTVKVQVGHQGLFILTVPNIVNMMAGRHRTLA